MIFTRTECQIASTPRHEMEVSVRIGATKEGKIQAIDVYTLLILVLMANMAQRLLAYLVINPFHFIVV